MTAEERRIAMCPPDLTSELLSLIRQIPPGRAATCGGLARALGNIAAARWVGKFLRRHEHDEDCPCHRVVLADGSLGGYAGGSLAEKRRRLVREKLPLSEDQVLLRGVNFTEFSSTAPLAKLAAIQERIRAGLRFEPPRAAIRRAAGLDVSYAGETGFGAYVIVECETGEVAWSTTVSRHVSFPYIPSYLAFRELPILLALWEAAAGQPADVLLVDGAGIMHPRLAGVASQFGALAGRPTIGVTKKLLYGQVDTDGMAMGETRPVLSEGRLLGHALRRASGSRRPLYVSPGNRIDADSATAIVGRLMLGRGLPAPIYWADRFSRRSAKESQPSSATR